MSFTGTINDILTNFTTIFNAIWIWVAFGLGLLLVPKVIGIIKSSFSTGRSR